MSAGGLRIGRPGTAQLQELWVTASATRPTYRHLGSTLQQDAALPGSQLHLGDGPDDFVRARAALAVWACHAGIGATVHPAATPIEVGRTVLVVVPVGPLAVVVPNRIVEVVDEPRRYGFAYGTLPGHQEQGEESFVVELRDDGAVMARICVDARPATVAARLAAPVVGWMQRRAIERYLQAWRSAVQR